MFTYHGKLGLWRLAFGEYSSHEIAGEDSRITISRRLYHTKEDIKQLKNWGSLRDGRNYDVSVISVDIVQNSVLVREYGTKTMEKLYFLLRRFLDRKLAEYDGRVWNWAGDGGILAFAFDDNVNRAVKLGWTFR